MSAAAQEEAGRMRAELARRRLRVVLVPAAWPRHPVHFVRAVEECNPAWYREFCQRYPSRRRDRWRWRKFKTAIRRAPTLRALGELAEGRVETVYAQRLLPVVKEQLNGKRG